MSDALPLGPTNPCPECGGPTHRVVGNFTTCGGLARPSAQHCDPCGKDWLDHPDVIASVAYAQVLPTDPTAPPPASRKVPASAVARTVPPGPWRLSSSGLSFDAGHIRVRLEGGTWAERCGLAAYLVQQAPK